MNRKNWIFYITPPILGLIGAYANWLVMPTDTIPSWIFILMVLIFITVITILIGSLHEKVKNTSEIKVVYARIEASQIRLVTKKTKQLLYGDFVTIYHIANNTYHHWGFGIVANIQDNKLVQITALRPSNEQFDFIIRNTDVDHNISNLIIKNKIIGVEFQQYIETYLRSIEHMEANNE